MRTVFKNAMVFREKGFEKVDIAIENKKLVVPFNWKFADLEKDNIFDFQGKIILPGLVDVHVHFREPGFFYKESIKTGSEAAAAGGFTAVCTMPNLKSPPSDLNSLKKQLDIIEKDSAIRIYPFGAITADQSGRGDLSKMKAMAPFVAGFSDDGLGVQHRVTMKEAMIQVASLDKIISAHCEDETLNQIPYKGTTRESESEQAKRDMELSKETGCKYHICHVSAKETLESVRKAKVAGVDVTCETAPHYAVFSTDTIRKEGRFKMNPPIKDEADRQAIVEALKDGTIDMIATDHAPHSLEEKSRGFENSAFGIVGLETSFAVMYTEFVDRGIISLERLVELMALAPRKRFDLPGGPVETGQIGDITVIDLEEEWIVDSSKFKTKGRATPFEGIKLKGRVLATFVEGKPVYMRGDISK